MRAVVLVGGEGTRLRPLTYRIPKQLIPLVEVPMLERSLATLARHGVDEVVLSMGYRPDAFHAALPDGRCAGVRVDYAVEPEPLDTGGGIAFAARHAGIDDTFLVLNGDVLQDFDITALVEDHRSGGAEATLALFPVEDPADFGLVVVDEGMVTAFSEKGEPREASMGNLISAGVYVFEPEVLDRLPAGERVHIETEVFPAMVTEGTLRAREMSGWWVDVGTRERYLEATAHLLGGESLVAERARVDESARVEGSVIGAGACVDADAAVERSAVLAGAKVGARAVVRDSIVGPDVVVPPGAVVEDEILAVEDRSS